MYWGDIFGGRSIGFVDLELGVGERIESSLAYKLFFCLIFGLQVLSVEQHGEWG